MSQQSPIQYAANDDRYQPSPQPYPNPISPINPMNNPGGLAPNPMNNMNGLAPNPMNDANAFALCNQGVANGFGPMFFNIRDPTFTQQNVPVKQPSSLHLPVVIFGIIFYGGLITGTLSINRFLEIAVSIIIIVIPYLVYLIVACCCSDIRSFISNSKRFDDYQSTYTKMATGRGYFKFWIECYHYVTVHTRRGSRRRKVVTHTAN